MKRILHISERTSVWRFRDVRIAAPARAFSTLGDEVALVTLLLKVHDDVGSAWGVAALLSSAAAPTVLLAGWAGRLVDTRDSRLLATVSAVWQAACCVALAWAGPLWLTLALVVVLQAGNAVSGTTWQALVPSMVGEAETGAAVAATQSLTTVAAVAGPPTAGLLVGGVGTGAPLMLDAATFLMLGVAALLVRTRRRPAAATSAGTTTALIPLEGLRSVLRDRLLGPLLLGMFVFILFGEVTNVVEVFLVRDALGASSLAYGMVGGATAAGIVVGSLCAGQVRETTRHVRVALTGAAVMAVMLVLAGLAPTVLVMGGAFAVLGVANGALNTSTVTLLLTRTPEQLRGRVLAAVGGAGRACSVGAVAIGGLSGAVLGPRPTFVASGLVTLGVVGWLALRMTRRFGERAGPVDVDRDLREKRLDTVEAKSLAQPG